MEAAREMENLLSASLSQEQEISRELHRRVRDLQVSFCVLLFVGLMTCLQIKCQQIKGL